MGSLKLTTASSGSVILSPANTASDVTITVPASTATMAINGPAFSAYQSSNQTLSTTTFTKLQFQTEEFDTANCFDSTTNYRFTPNVAGYYQFNGAYQVGGSATSLLLSFYKNGSEFKRCGFLNTNNSQISGTTLIYCNGSTDYVELYGYIGSGQALDGSSIKTYFQASMVRAA